MHNNCYSVERESHITADWVNYVNQEIELY